MSTDIKEAIKTYRHYAARKTELLAKCEKYEEDLALLEAARIKAVAAFAEGKSDAQTDLDNATQALFREKTRESQVRNALESLDKPIQQAAEQIVTIEKERRCDLWRKAVQAHEVASTERERASRAASQAWQEMQAAHRRIDDTPDNILKDILAI